MNIYCNEHLNYDRASALISCQKSHSTMKTQSVVENQIID